MNTSSALIVAGIVFALVALMHLMRLFSKSEITVAGKNVPMWTSIIAFIVSLSLAIWMLTLALGVLSQQFT